MIARHAGVRLDIKSFAMAVLGTEFRETSKRNMPKPWFTDRTAQRPYPFVKIVPASKKKTATKVPKKG